MREGIIALILILVLTFTSCNSEEVRTEITNTPQQYLRARYHRYAVSKGKVYKKIKTSTGSILIILLQ